MIKKRNQDSSRFIILLLGLGLNIAGTIALFVIFMFAFTHDNEVLLYINSIHERWFELFMISGIVILGVLTFVYVCRIYKLRQNTGRWSVIDKTCIYGCELSDNSREELAIHYLKWHSADKNATEWARRYINALTNNRYIDPVCGLEYSKCQCVTPMDVINQYYLK
jgi:hypothetical protein